MSTRACGLPMMPLLALLGIALIRFLYPRPIFPLSTAIAAGSPGACAIAMLLILAFLDERERAQPSQRRGLDLGLLATPLLPLSHPDGWLHNGAWLWICFTIGWYLLGLPTWRAWLLSAAIAATVAILVIEPGHVESQGVLLAGGLCVLLRRLPDALRVGQPGTINQSGA